MAPSGPSYDRAPLASGHAAYQALGWFGRHFHLGRLGPVVTCQRSVLQVLQAQMSELNKLPLVILSASLGLEAAARVEAPGRPHLFPGKPPITFGAYRGQSRARSSEPPPPNVKPANSPSRSDMKDELSNIDNSDF